MLFMGLLQEVSTNKQSIIISNLRIDNTNKKQDNALENIE